MNGYTDMIKWSFSMPVILDLDNREQIISNDKIDFFMNE